jgi:hypothetical protein
LPQLPPQLSNLALKTGDLLGLPKRQEQQYLSDSICPRKNASCPAGHWHPTVGKKEIVVVPTTVREAAYRTPVWPEISR